MQREFDILSVSLGLFCRKGSHFKTAQVMMVGILNEMWFRKFTIQHKTAHICGVITS